MDLALTADSSWNRWHPSYDVLGERCQRHDIHALELAYYPKNEGFERAAEILAGYDVNIVCVNATAQWRMMVVDDPSEAQRAIVGVIDIAAELGASFVVTYPGHNPLWDFRETVELYRRRMEPCLQRAADLGITMLLENHFDLRGEDPEGLDVVRRPDLTALFIDALDAPHVKVNFDPGNVYAAGIEPWPYAYRVLRDYIAYAHLKDMAHFSELLYGPLSRNETLADSRAGIFLPVALGDGGVNYRGLLAEMSRDGVARYAAFEDHSLPENADEILSRGVVFAREAMAASNRVSMGLTSAVAGGYGD